MNGRLENLLGALVLALDDEMKVRIEALVGLGPSAPAALQSVLRRPEQSIESLRHAVGRSHSATVRLVDRMEEAGLVIRRAASDGRQVSLSLSTAGHRMAMRVLQERRSVMSRAVVGMSDVERRSFELVIEWMLRTQAAAREDPTPICRLCELSVCPLRRCPVPGGR